MPSELVGSTTHPRAALLLSSPNRGRHPQGVPMSEATVASSDRPAAPGLRAPDQAFFEAFGFLRLPGALAADIAEITEAFDRVFAETPAVSDVGELNVETMGEALTRAG